MKPMLVMVLMFACARDVPPATTSSLTEPQMTPATTTTASATGPLVILPNGSAVRVELAFDDDSRAQGLMDRDHLAPDTGMLFFFEREGEYPFWMKNTRIPLDMIWIDANRRIAHIKHEVPPCRVADCPSYAPNAEALYVLELAGGEARRYGLKVGDTLRFEQTDHVIAR